MKKLFTILIAISFQLLIINYNSNGQGLKNVIVEKYYISDVNDTSLNSTSGTLPIGSVTYRIYAEMLPGYKFEAAYGINNPLHELRLSTTTQFFNNTDRGGTTANDIKNTYLKNNTVLLDSWLSVGAGSSANFGVLKGEDTNGPTSNSDGILQNTDPNAGIPLKTEDGLMPGTPQPVTTVGIDDITGVFSDGSANGNLFSTTNGSWASLNGSYGPTTTNRVLIAQITTDGIFTFKLNIQIGTPTGDVENYVANNPVGAEKQRDFLTYSSATSNMKPIVKITSPTDTSKINEGEKINITANAFDPDGTVASVEFLIDGSSIGAISKSPFTINWTAIKGNHNIQAVATDNKGAKDTSDVNQITVLEVGISQLKGNNEQFIIYPNPVKNILNISINLSNSEQGNTNLNIYNNIGEIIYQKQFNSKEQIKTNVDMSSLPSGIYVIQLLTNDKAYTRKIVKN